ncbi:MAG: rhodanese-like domain-containing protein [Saprospiraceae bacterium]|nr:rhodanese-like domain-containing protein [Candidatus Vicinibacter proximus]MBL7822242.1 rhodanese-like domain-containing protein [Saprospiraceae bacterium]MCC6842994.1 rhodanese-like domain-containing protein [Saprospiraceae bacterium]
MRILLLLNFIVLYSNINAQETSLVKQARVKSKSYQLLLNTLLKHSVTEIEVSELASRIDQYVLLDSRELKEYEVSHLQGAKWVGYDNFNIQNLKYLDKDCPIVCYCSVGYRSEKICEKLKANGFNNVSNLYGSIFEWANSGYPLYDSEEKLTNKVHGFSKLWGKYMNNKTYKKVYN